MTGTVTLPGQGAYKREQQHVSAEQQQAAPYGNGEGAPCMGQMRKPGSQVMGSPHNPARGTWRHATPRTVQRGEC